jgi:hypothetical protein
MSTPLVRAYSALPKAPIVAGPPRNGEKAVLDDLTYDDSEYPTIGLVRAGVQWEEVQDHIKIAHSPLLVPLKDGGQYVGAYWAGTKLVIADDLGPDQDQAVREFREFLRERGEA